MPQNNTVSLSRGVWTQLTNSDITSVTFQNVGGDAVLVKATTDTTAPTNDAGAIRYAPGQGERNVAMSDLFPGLAGADRLWALAAEGGRVTISHA